MPRDFTHLDETNRYIVEDHCANPRHADRLSEPTVTAELENPFCGDYAFVQLAVVDGEVRDLCVVGTGCVICRSSASMMAETLAGERLNAVSDHVAEFRQLMSDPDSAGDLDRFGDAAALAGVARFPVRVKCAMLPWAALQDALGRLDESAVQ